MHIRNLIFFLVFVTCGVLIAMFSVPSIHNQLGSDFVRTELILKTLKDKESPPDLVLFGNSILMNGIDGQLLSKISGGTKVYNLSSSGQNLYESSLYYQEVPAGVKMVVQFVQAELLSDFPKNRFDDRVARNFYLYGYRPRPETYRLLGDSLLNYFKEPFYEIYADSRAIVSTSINQSFRRVLRKDLNLRALATEIYYPYTYTTRLDSATYFRRIQVNSPPELMTTYQVSPEAVAVLNKMKDYFSDRGIEYKVVVFPINPDLSNFSDRYKSEAENILTNLTTTKFDLISMINLLNADEFIDHVHPTPEGAKKMTQAFAEKIYR